MGHRGLRVQRPQSRRAVDVSEKLPGHQWGSDTVRGTGAVVGGVPCLWESVTWQPLGGGEVRGRKASSRPHENFDPHLE